ncbi:MAG: hypothetical protein K9J06_15030 [Flavobacteriales bacterium]|nr:hypothetical protein [Flavobacteriales bacterium]
MKFRLLPLPFVLLGLLAGITGGFMRLGWALPLPQGAIHHGLLMTGGFLGTLITVERTVGMASRWWRLFPALSSLGTVLVLSGQITAGITAYLLGGIGLLALYLHQMTMHRDPYWYVLLAGGVCWTVGNLMLLLTGLNPAAATWWAGFIFLTIVGERLELTRYLPVPNWAKGVLWALLSVYVCGLVLQFHGAGRIVLGAATAATAIWLLRYDMARLAVRKEGFHRYIGGGLLVGYLWLLFQGVTLLFLADRALFYDLFIHAFFLGFAFSMIWAHAPIILPAVLRIQHRPFHPLLWAGWTVFQLTLIGRMTFALLGEVELRRIFGIANGFTVIAMFMAMAGIMVWKTGQNKVRQR